MKSLLITFDYPPDIGGMAEYYAMIVKRANGHVEVLHLQYKKTRLSWLSYLPELFYRKKTIQEFLVGNILPLGYCALIFNFFYGTPYSVYAHGKDVFYGLSVWKRLFARVILSNAKIVYVNSEYTRGEIVKLYKISRKKIVVEYPRVDVFQIEKNANYAPKRHKDPPFVLLSVGRLVKRKGFDMAIRALSRLKDKKQLPACSVGRSAVSYWIIGDGEDEPRLRALAKTCNMENAVRFFGAVSRQEIYGYYKACDAFIMPSRDIDGDVEGFGIVFLEAAVFGKPVIGGRSGGVPEAIEDGVTGLLVDPLNVEDIASAIERLVLNPEEARKIGEEGYKRVRKKFDYDSIISDSNVRNVVP